MRELRSAIRHLPFAIRHLHICGLAVLWLIVIIFLALGIAYSVLIPSFEVSDELWHFPMVQYIATHWELPVQPLQPGAEAGPWQQEGSQPPLYYGLAALITSGIDTSDMEQAYRFNPQAVLGVVPEGRHDLNLALHHPSLERFPWHGTILALHLARLFSVVLGAWAIYLGWRLVSTLAPKSQWLPLASAATHAFTPMFIFISASVNNDALVIPLSILALLLMLQTLKGELVFPKAEFMTGIAVGLAILTKEGALGLLPLAGATSLWIAWHTTDRPAHPTGRWLLDFCKRLLAWAIPVVLIAGWWYWRNERLYGDWLGLNAFLNVSGTRTFTPGIRELWAERFSFMAAYWGNFGGLNILMPQWIYTTLNFGAVVAGVGLVRQFCSWVFNSKKPWLKLWPFSWNQTTAARALALIWP
ncbi:MAG: glycosyltransferase family 39 protein, partial [Anaerolineae bacterium]|nr:glycosyltransferase family 39 protein [Anaerolineae bacterium]